MHLDIGIAAGDRDKLAHELSGLLANTYTLYLKTHNFHWNVTGSLFATLHLLFEQQYTELALAVDAIAERIRALGHPAPGSYTEFIALSSIKDAEGVPPARRMVHELAEGHEAVIRVARAMLPVADDANDVATADLVTQRIQVHEKAAWMLRSLLED
jgi:starvation-inducible DNA-binding protein